MTDAEMADHLGVPEAFQENAEWCCDCFPRLAERIGTLDKTQNEFIGHYNTRAESNKATLLRFTDIISAIDKTQTGLLKQIEELTSRVADLETVIDEIPNMGALFGAVQELQEQHEAPANTFTHYIGGSRL